MAVDGYAIHRMWTVVQFKVMVGMDADILCEGRFGVIRGKGNGKRFARSFR